jgi:RNA polymerase sigma-70 factor (ECF subfamily)
MPVQTVDDTFTEFAMVAAPRLNQALIAVAGDVGRDAASEALLYGWEHWDRVGRMENPTGYLYRVGLSRARRYPLSRWRPVYPEPPTAEVPWVEPKLASALARLSSRQRATALLLHGFGWTVREVADVMGISAGSVQKHDERAMAKLRSSLGVGIDA